MINKLFRKFSVLLLLLVTGNLFAQMPTEDSGKPVEMADVMRANGKIYVVVAVLVVILAGLLYYVVQTDRKISRLEKEQ
jgi:CcmD family protein